jgi:hypothetical protein
MAEPSRAVKSANDTFILASDAMSSLRVLTERRSARWFGLLARSNVSRTPGRV